MFATIILLSLVRVATAHTFGENITWHVQYPLGKFSDNFSGQAHTSMGNLVDDLLVRALKTSSGHHADLDEATLGKTGYAAARSHSAHAAQSHPGSLRMRSPGFPLPVRLGGLGVPSSLRRTYLRAAEGPPKYEKMDGLLRKAEVVGHGSVMLHVDYDAGDAPMDYKPGHVVALEMEDKNGVAGKNSADNGGWMRGPYTISRSTKGSVDILIKVVGAKSRAFAAAEPNAPVKIGGKFHVPILDGIEKEKVQRIVLISTGVGVGPCVGAIETALEDDAFPPIELFASYRTQREVVYADLLNSLSAEHPHRFKWNALVTSETGRISNDGQLDAVCSKTLGLGDTHFHLIGNAQLVNEWKKGLEKAGVPDNRVTVEMYFNHKAEPDGAVVDRIAAAISTGCAMKV